MRPICRYLAVLLLPSMTDSWRSAFVHPNRYRITLSKHELAPTPLLPGKRPTTRWMQHTRGGGDSPKLVQWIGPAFLSALSYALYNIFIKLGSASIHPVLGGVILQFVAALLGSCLLGLSRDKLTFDKKGVLWSVCAGVCVGLAEILSFQVSGMGVPASNSTPVMIGGSVAFGSVLGFVLLRERMTMKGWLGALLVVLGIVCVATDPGVKMASH